MAQPNLGAQKLRAWLDVSGLTYLQASRVLGCDPSTIHNLLIKGKVPQIATAQKIREGAGIPVDDWTASASDESASTANP